MRPETRAAIVRVLAAGFYGSRGIRVLSTVAGYAAFGGSGVLAYRRHPAFPILVYHRVNDERDPFFPSLPTEVFERQMRFVARAYRAFTMEELVERMRCGSVPRNALAITFDDGYRDVLTHAAPVLARYRLPATVFLATGFIGTAEVPWFDRLAMAFRLTKASSITTPWGEIMPLEADGDRIHGLQRTLDALKRVQDEDFRRTLHGLLETLGITDQRGFKGLMLSWDDVHALTGLGFAIGAHTVNHPILSRVGPERARLEIEGSRAMIESASGRTPRAFAYPNGRPEDYSKMVVRLVREAGFTCAVTTRFGVNTQGTSPWELRRGQPWEHDLPTFALKLAWYRMAA